MSTSSVGQPGKYQRSGAALVAALVITVVAVGGLLWVLGLFRPDVDNRPEEIDYLAFVAEAQDARLDPVYPASLPDGWLATGYEVEAVDAVSIELRILTANEKFVGVVQADASAGELLTEYVDDDNGAEPTEIIEVDGSVAQAWQGYADDGGDTAYSAEVGKQTVLVYGSASAADLQDIVERLTTKPLD